MRKFLNKLTCIALSLTFLMGCMATPAFAYGGEETTTPSIFETEEEPVIVVEQDAGPLTPEQLAALLQQNAHTTPNPTALEAVGANTNKEEP